ncbi:hypothetical protein BJX63DRAFT_426247 [Aspergillus granulosus]|uniref:LysM domain-containing protein n=1 Tax=Aspergillus granulosus TaxID=176169 RepID=A0ABR4GTF1_9EURO
MVSSILLQCFLFSIASSSAVKRWTNGDSPTGPTDPNVSPGCTYWANDISPGDSCASILSYFGISTTQFVSWNPSLLSECSLNVGWSYCVDGPAVTTTRTTTTKPTTSTTTTTTITHTTTTTTTTTATGGWSYDITASFGNFTLAEFYAWNPYRGWNLMPKPPSWVLRVYRRFWALNLDHTTTATTISSTATSTTATVTGPTPQQTGIVANCNKYHLVESGDGCASIANAYGIPLSNFYTWNPAVGSSCGSLWLGYYVCVGTSLSDQPTTTTTRTTNTATTITSTAAGPSPTQSGLTKTCTSYYKAAAGDTCEVITQQKYPYINSVPLFVRWNPAVGSTCSNLLAGYYYCVATELHQPMPGIINTCKRYYQVKTGDTCWSIQQKYGITAAHSCGSLWVGYFICVGV